MIHSDEYYIARAIEQSRNCTPSASAYSVGALVVTLKGGVYEGYTHETSELNHAEEEAVEKALSAGETLYGATMYSSMEPCSTRSSKPRSCSQLIIDYGFSRVVFAMREPGCFVDCRGEEMLREAKIEVKIMHQFESQVEEINKHIVCK